MDDLNRLGAALGAANDVLTGLELHIERYGREAAQAAIDAANAAADARVAEAEERAQEQADLAAELRRQRDAMEVARDRAVEELRRARADAEELRTLLGAERTAACEARHQRHQAVDQRVAAWSPKGWPSKPLTDAQDEAARLDPARTDWPVWVAPCDPAVTTDGDTLWLSCTGDDLAESASPTPIRSIEPGDRWSELAAEVAGHRCGTPAD
jgi:hypothetical protein